MSKLKILVPILLFLASPAPCRGAAAAQDDRVELSRAVIQADRREIIARTMRLQPEQEAVFWRLFAGYSEDIGLVKERRVQLVTEYVEQYDEMTDEQAAPLLERWLDLELEAARIRRTWVKKFLKKLPATTVARFFQLDSRLELTIRAEIAELIPVLG